MWRSQRAPSRFLLVALFALLFASATGLERLRRLAAVRRPGATLALAWLLAGAVAGDLWWESRGWQGAATGAGVASRAHRPRPEVVKAPGAVAELVEFAPNVLVYAVDAQVAARVVLPLRYGSGPGEWQVEGATLGRDGPWIALGVERGRSRASLRYRTPGLALGAGVTSLAVLACAAWVVVSRRSPGGTR